MACSIEHVIELLTDSGVDIRTYKPEVERVVPGSRSPKLLFAKTLTTLTIFLVFKIDNAAAPVALDLVAFICRPPCSAISRPKEKAPAALQPAAASGLPFPRA
jgi:hypothetical protein